MKRILWMSVVAQFMFCGFLSAQTIADIARRERNRQKQSESKIVVRSGTTTTTAVSTTSTSASPAAATPPAKPTELTDNQGRNEKYWRTAFQKAREDAKRADDRVQLIELKVKDLNSQLLTRSDIYNRENTLGPQITQAQKELDEARQTAAQAKQTISDLEEALRRSGGPAGWAR